MMDDKLKRNVSRFKDALAHWFRRCNGADSLGLSIVAAGLILALADRFLRTGLLTLLAAALYIWALYRTLSHNIAARHEENRRFLAFWQKLRIAYRQGFVRLKNLRTYKYYRCPNCRSRLRMPRGLGEKTVTCSHCGHSFRKKA